LGVRKVCDECNGLNKGRQTNSINAFHNLPSGMKAFVGVLRPFLGIARVIIRRYERRVRGNSISDLSAVAANQYSRCTQTGSSGSEQG
jgi:hypothetical protein